MIIFGWRMEAKMFRGEDGDKCSGGRGLINLVIVMLEAGDAEFTPHIIIHIFYLFGRGLPAG